MKKLRYYQSDLIEAIYKAWETLRNVLATAPTGGGKTFTFAHILQREKTPSVVIAHRSEILVQICIALSEYGVPHKVLAPMNTVRNIMKLERLVTGKSYVDQQAICTVAGVDTLMARSEKGLLDAWFESVTLVVEDEAHHLQEANKWGKALALFPNARCLGVTATPTRSDGGGLAKGLGGVFDTMIEGPSMRTLIDEGFLTPYKIFVSEQSIDLSDVNITATGDYSKNKLVKAARASPIVGDVVRDYLKFARGKRGITFVTDVETAHEVAARFNAAGVPAAALSAKTPDAERIAATQKLKSGELMQLVNVDLFGEGFDLPAIEVVSMARPTASYGLYVQQFGRALRIMAGKPYGIIIDHVGNVIRHGLPDTPRDWGFGVAGFKLKKDEGPPMRECLNPYCMQPWEGYSTTCPHCGHKKEPESRESVEAVEGDLVELTPEMLEKLRGEIKKADRSPDDVEAFMKHQGHGDLIALGAAKQQRLKNESQVALRDTMNKWGGYARDIEGLTGSDRNRAFYLTFKVDVLSAQALNRKDAEALDGRISKFLEERG